MAPSGHRLERGGGPLAEPYLERHVKRTVSAAP
jgi:hypothetical protein